MQNNLIASKRHLQCWITLLLWEKYRNVTVFWLNGMIADKLIIYMYHVSQKENCSFS